MITKELVGKILTDLNDAAYEINVAQTAIRADIPPYDLQFDDLYCDLQEADKELDKIIKRLEPYDE